MLTITPCVKCEVWDNYERMKIIGNELYCDECYEELEGDKDC